MFPREPLPGQHCAVGRSAPGLVSDTPEYLRGGLLNHEEVQVIYSQMQRKSQIHTVHQNSLATALFGHNVLERLNKHKCIPSHTNTNTHTHRNTH